MEVYVNGPLGKGYLDLLDVETDEYYEVKSKGAYDAGRHILQMEKYDVATIQNTRGNRRMGIGNIGSPVHRGKRNVSGNFQYGFYDITFSLAEDGVIVYNPSFNYLRAAFGVSLVLICTFAPEAFLFLAPAMAESFG